MDQIYERRQSLVEDLRSVVEEAARSLKKRTTERDVVLNLQISDKLPPVIGDRTYLLSAIRHLMDNGIKFSPRDTHAEVKVILREEAGEILFEVCDEGPGIPGEEVERLFDTFYQINREKNEQQGAGAGLAIVRHVAALHGGSVEVETHAGDGSCFRLRLPSLELLNRTA
jgi:signal transduction histidine kinase